MITRREAHILAWTLLLFGYAFLAFEAVGLALAFLITAFVLFAWVISRHNENRND